MNNFITIRKTDTMSKILFPTDFSEKSKKALSFAQYLSARLGSELVLFHSSMDVAEKTVAQVKLNSLVEQLKASNPTDSKSTYSSLNVDGLPVAQVTEQMSVSDYKMLVIPTTGDHRDDFHGIYLKSNTSAVMENITKPVLFYPEQTSVKEITNVLIAVDVLNYSKDILLDLLSYIHLFNANVKFVYASISSADKVTEAITLFNSFLSKEMPGAKLEVVMTESFAMSIDEVIKEKSVDLLIMTKFKQHFWEKWFMKSATEDMAYVASIPVLVLTAQ